SVRRGSAIRGGAGGSCEATGAVASLAGTIRPRPNVSLTADTPDNTASPTASDARSAIADTSVQFRGATPCVKPDHARPAAPLQTTTAMRATCHENGDGLAGGFGLDSFADASGNGAMASKVSELSETAVSRALSTRAASCWRTVDRSGRS